MTAIELLQKHGPMPAEHLAAWLGIEEPQVYVQLVRAYDAGQARINTGHSLVERTWEALDEVTA